MKSNPGGQNTLLPSLVYRASGTSYTRTEAKYKLLCHFGKSLTVLAWMLDEGAFWVHLQLLISMINNRLLFRLITLYQILHDSIHAKSGQKGTLKLQYIKTRHESVMGWVRSLTVDVPCLILTVSAFVSRSLNRLSCISLYLLDFPKLQQSMPLMR